MDYKLKILIPVILTAGFITFAAILAQEKFEIQFPLKELGNCRSKVDCEEFCDQKENALICLEFAEKQGIMSKVEVERARKFFEIKEEATPGGCATKGECELYCQNVNHFDECLAFGSKYGLLDKTEREKARKIADVLKQGSQTPGSCRSKKECMAYCAVPEHMEECLNFAQKAGLIPKDELEEAQRIMSLIIKGETPGQCKSKTECQAYCEVEANFNECLEFGRRAGFIKEEQYEIAKKTKGKGPGGCKGKEACESFCNNPDNQEICFNFAKDHGLISEAGLQRIKEGIAQIRISLKEAPTEVIDCLKQSLGENIITDIENGTFIPGSQIGDKIKACFESFKPQMRQKLKEFFDQEPPEVRACLKKKVSQDLIEKIKDGEIEDPSINDNIRLCIEEFRSKEKAIMSQIEPDNMPLELKGCLERKTGQEKIDNNKNIKEVMRECLKEKEVEPKSYDNPIFSCIEEVFGQDSKEKFMRGELKEDEEFKMKIKPCLEKLDERITTKEVELPKGIMREASTTKGRHLPAKIEENCLEVYRPLCGVDGRTYANECLAGDAPIAYEGPCKKELDASKIFVPMPFRREQQLPQTFDLEQTQRVELDKPPQKKQLLFERQTPEPHILPPPQSYFRTRNKLQALFINLITLFSSPK